MKYFCKKKWIDWNRKKLSQTTAVYLPNGTFLDDFGFSKKIKIHT